MLLLPSSLDNDPIQAQMTMKNVVLPLLAAHTHLRDLRPEELATDGDGGGIPLAVLPLATMQVAYFIHIRNSSAGWGWCRAETQPERPVCISYGLDAVFLLILAAISWCRRPRPLSRLRRQVAEAKLLGQYRLRRADRRRGDGGSLLGRAPLLNRPAR